MSRSGASRGEAPSRLGSARTRRRTSKPERTATSSTVARGNSRPVKEPISRRPRRPVTRETRRTPPSDRWGAEGRTRRSRGRRMPGLRTSRSESRTLSIEDKSVPWTGSSKSSTPTSGGTRTSRGRTSSMRSYLGDVREQMREGGDEPPGPGPRRRGAAPAPGRGDDRRVVARVENENSPARILTPEEHARALEVASRRTAKLTPLSVLEGPESADDFAARREEARALSRGELGRSPWNAKVKERDDAITVSSRRGDGLRRMTLREG